MTLSKAYSFCTIPLLKHIPSLTSFYLQINPKLGNIHFRAITYQFCPYHPGFHSYVCHSYQSRQLPSTNMHSALLCLNMFLSETLSLLALFPLKILFKWWVLPKACNRSPMVTMTYDGISSSHNILIWECIIRACTF